MSNAKELTAEYWLQIKQDAIDRIDELLDKIYKSYRDVAEIEELQDTIRSAEFYLKIKQK